MKHAARKLGLAAALALASLASASPAAAVTIGQVSPGAPVTCSGANVDFAQQNVGSGDSYTVPNTGGIDNWTLTSWRTNANANPGSVTMKVFRPLGGTNLQAVAHDGPRALTVSALNTFQTNLAVKAGDYLGLHTVDAGLGCSFAGAAGDARLFLNNSDLADGQSATFNPLATGRVNVSAQIDPTNTFTVGAVTRNKKKGTATEAITVPNPGTAAVSGGGVKTAAAREAVSVAAGTVQLPIRAKGKKKSTLNSTGKVKVTPTITYTPTGGAAKSLAVKVKLRKR